MRARVRTRVTVDATFSRRVQAAANQAARITFDQSWEHILDTMGSPVWRWTPGRVTYRGRVMNRAARIHSKASSGTCWCSHETYLSMLTEDGDNTEV